jgi:hypothetical protein
MIGMTSMRGMIHGSSMSMPPMITMVRTLYTREICATWQAKGNLRVYRRGLDDDPQDGHGALPEYRARYPHIMNYARRDETCRVSANDPRLCE